MKNSENGNVMLRNVTHARRRLVREMLGVNFGRLENLEVKTGEPVFTPKTNLITPETQSCPRV